MERIIDVSVVNGTVFFEDEGFWSDFETSKSYLFSISYEGNKKVKTFVKDFPRAENPGGEYYLALFDEPIDEGFWHDDEDRHIEALTVDGADGDYIVNGYDCSLLVNLDEQTAVVKYTSFQMEDIISESYSNAVAYGRETQPYSYM